MNDILIPNLKLLFKPLVIYYGEWELGPGLKDIALVKKDKNLYEEFLERYYYMPLRVIFKDDEIIKNFDIRICSKMLDNKRCLYFSKRAFLRNLIGNIDEIIDLNGEDAYKQIKKAIRIKKDHYRDVEENKKESEFYEEVLSEYYNSNVNINFDEFVISCKKQYTKLLSGYNAVLDLFDKSINLDRFISCFDIDRLYLYTCYCLLKHNKDYYDKFGRLDYNISFIDTYKGLVEEKRAQESFYTTSFVVQDPNEKIVYSVDDLFKEYNEFMSYVK